MKPALSAEEWEADEVHRDTGVKYCSNFISRKDPNGHESPFICIDDGGEAQWLPHSYYHPMAALCLHGQPFGFTREDVKTLYYVARTLQFHTNLLDERLLNLSDRIEALLPPKQNP